MEILRSQLYKSLFEVQLSVAYGICVLHLISIFNWMQSKLTGKPQIKKPNLKLFDDHKVQKPPKEDQPISEWPHGLLTIGTLGSNHESKEDLHAWANPPPSPRDPLHDFTPAEATHIQNELNSFFNEHVDQSSYSAAELGKFLNRQSSLKLTERTNSNAADSDELKEHFNSQFQRSASVVLSRGKDVNCLENTNTAIGKKSILSFLLKKMFVCSSGFAPPVAAPALRDPIPESRMEKLLRAILHKKIYPQQSSNSTVSKKKYLENRHITKSVTASEEQLDPKRDDSDSNDDGSKWDKTDSEYIVLEI
ncbi:protein DEEPER ROOTING 1-like [Rosa rugosa]|uniref:protein DEEPER ROOTING 1-like n=1 Tax=Rosa rugosa TaxID=74645 RepID=UPI002B406047|nr:protein DEEPER ROOTING 1-like [Rosa rugosa]